MTVVNMRDLPKIREKYKDKKIVFCSGGFDLTHVGHILFFEDCKKYGDILVVAVGTDNSLKKRKGDGRPILNEHIRIKTIDSLKPVDYCFINKKEFDVNKPLATIETTFAELKPNVYVINEDAFDISYRQKLCNDYHVKLVILPRWFPPEFDGISTSKIIEKIKQLHND